MGRGGEGVKRCRSGKRKRGGEAEPELIQTGPLFIHLTHVTWTKAGFPGEDCGSAALQRQRQQPWAGKHQCGRKLVKSSSTWCIQDLLK